MRSESKAKSVFFEGLRDGIPIALGYFAVAFSLGIAARGVGVSVLQGVIASALCMASAGEYALFSLIGAGATLWEMALVTLVTNARYLLMSCALSQKIDPRMKNIHRYLFGAVITDEIFGITIARPGCIDPLYNYGAIAVSVPGWAIGTGLGILLGNLLPGRIVSALSVALFGMFIAVIIPPSKENKVICGCVAVSFAAALVFDLIPLLAQIPSGTRTIILTVLIASAAALLFPVKEAEDE